MSTKSTQESIDDFLKVFERDMRKTVENMLVPRIKTNPNYSGEIKINNTGAVYKRAGCGTIGPLYSSILGKYINPATGEVVETEEKK